MSSVLNFTLLHHTVVGFEALGQMEMAGHWPDIIIGCVGGGSNFLGLAALFLGRVLREKRKLRAIAAEPAACPSLTRGRYAYDFLDSARIGPVVKMHTLGSNLSNFLGTGAGPNIFRMKRGRIILPKMGEMVWLMMSPIPGIDGPKRKTTTKNNENQSVCD
jgi:hypothetical protein